MADEPSFDQIVARLREVVVRLESGELTLEQSLQVYEEGVQMARRGQQLLAAAEKRVEILVSASGTPEVSPFDVDLKHEDAPASSSGASVHKLGRGSSPG